MGIGPVPAIKAALNKADKSLQHMELIEVLLLRCKVKYWVFYVLLCLCNSFTCVAQVVLFKSYCYIWIIRAVAVLAK